MLKSLALSTAVLFAPIQFTDLNERYEAPVNQLVELEITKGITETQYGVDQLVKRGDSAVMLHKILKVENVPCEAVFTDVNQRQAPYIFNLWRTGVIQDLGNKFDPERPITREEFGKWVYLAFAGDDEMEHREWLFLTGIIQGDRENGMRWDEPITRGEFAIVLDRVIKFY